MLPRAIVGGGAAGATSEAMMGRDATEGAGVGAVLGPVGYYGAKGANAVVNELLRMKGGARGRAVESTQDMFKKGDRLEQTIKDLENTTPIVAGERPTAGLAATAATPELAVLEAGARSRQNANLFTQADEATAAARQRAVGQVALPATPRTDIVTGKHLPTTAQAFRTRGSENFYDQAMTDIVPIDRKVARVLNAPDIQAATRDAFDDFQTSVRNASAQGERAPARGKWNQDRGFYETMSIDQLQRISKQIDARLASDPKNFNLNQARQVLQDTMNQSDNYNLATIIFKERSKGVNQSEVAQQLLEKLDSPKQYLNAMNDPKMLLKAAKVPRAVKTLDEVYLDNRGDLQTLKQVGQSLKRQKKLAEMKTAQGIVPRFMSPAEKTEQVMPNWLNAKVTLARSLLKTVGRVSDEAVQKELDVAMSDPRAMAALLKDLPPTERNRFVNALRGIVGQEGMLQYGIGPATGQLQEGLN
jgi:hypothetical protein